MSPVSHFNFGASSRALLLCVTGICVSAQLGCNLTQAGQDPPRQILNFPIAIATSGSVPDEGARWLYVVNSNFDVRYNSASIQVYDLALLRAAIANCTPGEDCVIPTVVDPGADVPHVLVSEVGIGSHADGITTSPDGTRLYLPVRSDRNLTFIDVDLATGELSCDATPRSEGDLPRCGESHRAGNEAGVASERGLTIDGDPIAVAAGRLEDVGGVPGSGDYVLLVLRDGRVALFIDQASAGGSVPELVHIAGGFPENLVTVTMEPGTGLGWLTAIGTDSLSRVGISVDPVDPARSFLFDFGPIRLGGVDDGEDTRDLQFDPTLPNIAYVLTRRPEAVVTVDASRRGLTAGDIALGDVYEVGAGPSRMVTTRLGPPGFERTYLLVTCFDARKLFIIDADHGALVSVVGGFSGPFELALDVIAPDNQLLYVTDFSVSVVRVVDLSPLATNGTPEIVATLGLANPVRSLTDM